MLSRWRCREHPDERSVPAEDLLGALEGLRCEECDSWRPNWVPGGCWGPVKGEEACVGA